MRDLAVNIFGDVGIATFNGHFTGTMNGSPTELQQQATMVFVELGRWMETRARALFATGGVTAGLSCRIRPRPVLVSGRGRCDLRVCGVTRRTPLSRWPNFASLEVVPPAKDRCSAAAGVAARSFRCRFR